MALRRRHRDGRGGRGGFLRSWALLEGRVARREGLGDRLVVALVLDSEALQLREERRLRVAQRDAVLRPARAGEARLDVSEVELDDLRVRRLLLRVVPEQVLLAVRLDERDPLGAASGQPEVRERLLVDREEAARRAVLGRHVPERRAVSDRKRRDAVAEVLDELSDDTGLPKDLRDRQHQVGRGCALGELTLEAEADDLRHEHRYGLAEHRRLGLDPAHAPAEHAEPVDHRRVRVGADERVGERKAVARLDDATEVLEVDLVADAGVRRHDLEVREARLAPPQERVALAVPLELELGVACDRRAGRELVDLDGVVDDELGRQQRIDLLRIAAEVAHRVAHRGEVDDRRNAREVLQQHARGRERDLVARLGLRVPRGDGLDVALVAEAEHVLEQDLERVREPLDVEAALQRVEAEDLVLLASHAQRRACGEGVGHGPNPIGRARDRDAFP